MCKKGQLFNISLIFHTPSTYHCFFLLLLLLRYKLPQDVFPSLGFIPKMKRQKDRRLFVSTPVHIFTMDAACRFVNKQGFFWSGVGILAATGSRIDAADEFLRVFLLSCRCEKCKRRLTTNKQQPVVAAQEQDLCWFLLKQLPNYGPFIMYKYSMSVSRNVI